MGISREKSGNAVVFFSVYLPYNTDIHDTGSPAAPAMNRRGARRVNKEHHDASTPTLPRPPTD